MNNYQDQLGAIKREIQVLKARIEILEAEKPSLLEQITAPTFPAVLVPIKRGPGRPRKVQA